MPGMSKQAARKLAWERDFTPRELHALVDSMEPSEEPTKINPSVSRRQFKEIFSRSFSGLDPDKPIQVERYDHLRRRHVKTGYYLVIVNILRELGAPDA